MLKIWCIEDDENINNLITYALASQGFEAEGMTCFADMDKKLQDSQPDLFLLDIMLPDTDGITILKKLKENSSTSDIPVIMLTAKNSEIDIVKALDLGAEDYITKPFGILEMVSRVKAVLRRCEKDKKSEDKLSFGMIVMDKERHRVTVDGETVELTLKEFSLLKLFLESPQRVLTRENIMDAVWGDSYVGESRTVDMHIKTLRHKLGNAGEAIVTIRGVGYKFEPVSE
ncbi:MAG: response regulator transcription factor [Oscillospiraceae bacterium]|nr:response regulator transcription factor [Oscillospiraceae bacterium]MBQ5324691.1 response regulator transcription factor [Oscillospiraceae bacterium]